MKRFFHLPMHFAYLLLILHSFVPHCHGECEDDAFTKCVTEDHQEEPAFIHLLVSLFTNAVHPALEEEAIFHIYASNSKISESIDACDIVASFGITDGWPGLPVVSVKLSRNEGKAVLWYSGPYRSYGITRGPPMTA